MLRQRGSHSAIIRVICLVQFDDQATRTGVGTASLPHWSGEWRAQWHIWYISSDGRFKSHGWLVCPRLHAVQWFPPSPYGFCRASITRRTDIVFVTHSHTKRDFVSAELQIILSFCSSPTKSSYTICLFIYLFIFWGSQFRSTAQKHCPWITQHHQRRFWPTVIPEGYAEKGGYAVWG